MIVCQDLVICESLQTLVQLNPLLSSPQYLPHPDCILNTRFDAGILLISKAKALDLW